MKNKTLITVLTILFAILLFSSSCFAANEVQGAVQGVRNFVGGAENVIEDAATGVSNTIRDGMDTTNNNSNSNDNMSNNRSGMTTDYTATRTATTTTPTGNATFLGLGATAWGWLIMAIVGIITVALVWYYGKEHEYNSNRNDDNY